MALTELSIRVGTTKELGLVVATSQLAHARFMREVVGISVPSVLLPEEQFSSLWCVFTRLWSLMRLVNEHIETWWWFAGFDIDLQRKFRWGAVHSLCLWGVSWGDLELCLATGQSHEGFSRGSGGG